MYLSRKMLAVIGFTLVTLSSPSDGFADDAYNCWWNGACEWYAYCYGDMAMGYCSIQCFQESTSCPLPGTCFTPGGAADCGDPVG